MSSYPQGLSICPPLQLGGTTLYPLTGSSLTNRYFILSGEGSRHLLSCPEVVGFPCYWALLDETLSALTYLRDRGDIPPSIDILTILRGGLNYPLEEACAEAGIIVRDIHFISCERILSGGGVITGLDIRYGKICPCADRVIAIGDIFATGDTLRLCMEHVVKVFAEGGCPIRRIVFFTVGGTRAFTCLEKMASDIRKDFPSFEGFDCFFYEGAFSVYEDRGESGLNVPDIDFGWKGALVCPEFRRIVIEKETPLFERCVIYDGGARRFEIPLHFREVLDYWEGIRDRSGSIDAAAFTGEKLGFGTPMSFGQWVRELHYDLLPPEDLEGLHCKEMALLEKRVDLGAIAHRRIEEINLCKRQYGED